MNYLSAVCFLAGLALGAELMSRWYGNYINSVYGQVPVPVPSRVVVSRKARQD
jgi:hypothetical protein